MAGEDHRGSSANNEAEINKMKDLERHLVQYKAYVENMTGKLVLSRHIYRSVEEKYKSCAESEFSSQRRNRE